MNRQIEPELLDELPSDDRRAVQSRRDLQKINAWMGHARTLGRALSAGLAGRVPEAIVELGCGDATLLLKLAKRFAPDWKPSRVVLVDRQPLLSPATRRAFEALSWRVEFVQMDVFEWLARANQTSDVTLATLFLHHFVDQDLRRLLKAVAAQTRLFVACEPRRFAPALAATRLLPVIGCNDVTRHDARLSVRAGFINRDLSELWPADGRWQMNEHRAGAFTHCFWARRVDS